MSTSPRALTRRHGSALLALAGLAVAGHYLWTINGIQDSTACLASYNTAVVGQIKARAAVTAERDSAEERADRSVDALLSGFAVLYLAGDPPSLETERAQAVASRRLFLAYQRTRTDVAAAREAVVRVRAANPLPGFPDC